MEVDIGENMTTFNWDEDRLELEIVNPQHPTYVPLSGNRCWALLPTNLDGYCHLFDTPNYFRILKRIGVYFKIGKKEGPLPKVLDNLRTFYGANYLRLVGDVANMGVEVKVFPDLEKSLIYLITYIENMSKSPIDISIIVAVDFEFHKPPWWGCYGFSEETAILNPGKRPIPKDDRIKVLHDGSLFVVSDTRDAGVAFVSSRRPEGWSLDRDKFSFDIPTFTVEGVETEFEDSFCAIQHILSIKPSQNEVLPVIIGYQEKENPEAIVGMLEKSEKAFRKTKNFYETPLIKGIQIETPDPIINAQFKLYNLFIKMAEHKCEGKHTFLAGAHYPNWPCPRDFFFTLRSYIYMNDLDVLSDGLGLYRSLQLPNGRIPEEARLWYDVEETEHGRNRRPDIKNTNEYIFAVCQYIKFRRDREYAMDIFPSLKKAAEAIRACKVEGLIAPGCSYGFDRADYPGGFGESPQVYTSAEAYKSLMDLSELATWLGYRDYAETIHAEAE